MALRRALSRLWYDEQAVTTVEYGLVLALLVVGCIVAFAGISSEMQMVVERGSETLERAAGMGCASG